MRLIPGLDHHTPDWRRVGKVRLVIPSIGLCGLYQG